MAHFPPIVFAIAFGALVIALTALARRLPIPTPILQVIAGFFVAFIPGAEIRELEPDLVFFVFLPPIPGRRHTTRRCASSRRTGGPSAFWRSGWSWQRRPRSQ
jgi:hypothetical protein